MNRVIGGFFWISLYILAVLTPVALMLVPPLPSGRAFLVELSVALGFVGLTQIGIQFILIARFKEVTAPYGIDVILKYHRQIAMVAVAFIVAHPLLLLIEHPARIALFNPLAGTYASKLGLASLFLLLLIVVTSVWRDKLKLNYEVWRVTHALFGIGALVTAQAHVSLAGLYINTPWKQAFWIVTSLLLVSLVGYLRFVKPAIMKRRPWRVASVEDEGGETYTLTIEPDGHDGMAFEPGQFAWIRVADSPYSVDEHPYSFSSSAEEPARISFGIKALGDFSKSIPDVEEGAVVYVDGPHGAFSIDRAQAPGYVFYGGGIGVTPLLSFLHTMADREDPRPVLVFYAGKEEGDLAYRDELEALKERLDLETVYVLEEPPDDWEHEEGFISKELIEERLPEERFGRNHFVCGPAPMMEAVEEALLEHGVSQTHIYLEKFELA